MKYSCHTPCLQFAMVVQDPKGKTPLLSLERVCSKKNPEYIKNGFSSLDGNVMIQLSLREFIEGVNRDMWCVLNYLAGMILRGLKDVELDQFDEVPESVRRKLEVCFIDVIICHIDWLSKEFFCLITIWS